MNRDYGIYLVTDTAQCGSRGVVETARRAVAGGVRVIQIRDKTGDAMDQLALLEAVGAAVGERACVLVNDRVDVYLAARARGARVHGVHIGQSDLPAAVTRELIGPDAVLGLTANEADAIETATALPFGTVDYLGVGSIRDTQTKPDAPAALGVGGFARLAAGTTLPCVAIGGILDTDVASLHAQGAAGAAVVSAICAAEDAEQAARKLVNAWHAEIP